MVLTETWLREQKTAELHVNGYTLFRQDRLRPCRRTGRDSGGVAIYLREDIAVDTEPILGYSNGVIEVLGLYNKSRNLLIFAVYRQPDDRVGGNRSTAAEFKLSLEEIKKVISIYADPMPEILLQCLAVEAASKPAMDSEAGKILVTLNRALTEKLRIKFRSVHALAKHDRPFTDYIWQCELDELKGVNVGQDYRSDKAAADFAHHIAEVSDCEICQPNMVCLAL